MVKGGHNPPASENPPLSLFKGRPSSPQSSEAHPTTQRSINHNRPHNNSQQHTTTNQKQLSRERPAKPAVSSEPTTHRPAIAHHRASRRSEHPKASFMASSATLFIVAVVALLSVASGTDVDHGRKLLQSSSTFSRSDRATAAIGASSDAINAAVAGTRTAKQATRDGVLFSRLAANAGARPADFLGGRKLLQSSSTFSRSDRATAAIGASSDAINAAVAGTRTAKQATRDGVLFSRLAANAGARPADFLGGRKLLQSSSTFSRSDRATAAIGASSDAINAAVAGDRTAKQATRDGVLFSRLAANAGARPADFLGGR